MDKDGTNRIKVERDVKTRIKVPTMKQQKDQ
jgi:hypothetical protein